MFQRKSLLVFLFLFFILVFFSLSNPSLSKAQSCTGSVKCCTSQGQSCTPAGCDPSCPDPNQCIVCTSCTTVCTSWDNGNICGFSPINGQCGIISPPQQCYQVQGGCLYTPGATPAPTSPPGWAACGSCNCGHGANGTGECQLDPNGVCQWNPCFCAGVNCGGGGGADPCPNDTCAGSCCNYVCATQPCIVTADCAPSSSGQPVVCAWGTNPNGSYCRNANCPSNTIPGALCGCSGGLTCGQKCAGGCTNNSTCRYTNAPAGNCTDGTTTYCIGDIGNGVNTYNPNYTTPQCLSGDTGNKYLLGPGGQTTGFTQAQIDSTCKPVAWWQVKDGDVITNGRVQSIIPLGCTLPGCTPYFNLNGTGGFPGIVMYGSNIAPVFAPSGGTGTVSSKKWLTNTTFKGKTYDYSFFEGLVPSTVQVNEITTDTVDGNYFQVNGTPSNNFVWFRRTGNLTITGTANVNGTRKVVLLVKGGNLTEAAQIRLKKTGDGFFMAVVNGNITFDPTLTGNAGQPAVEGLFLADGTISTGAGNQQLYVRGSLAGLSGINLQRDLVNNNAVSPAELIEYAPDFLFSYPRDLTRTRIIWREVAP